MKKVFILLLGITLLFTGSFGFAAPKNSMEALNESLSKSQIHLPKSSYKHRNLFNNKELLQLLRMDVNQLKKEIDEGISLADIATKQGVEPQAVIDLLVNQANQRIDQGVKDGRINQEQAQLRKSVMKSHLKDAVEGKGFYYKGFHSRKHRLHEVAVILEMTSEEMIQQLNNGKSIGDIAKEKGVSKKKLINSLLKKEKEYITEWVEKTWQIKK